MNTRAPYSLACFFLGLPNLLLGIMVVRIALLGVRARPSCDAAVDAQITAQHFGAFTMLLGILFICTGTWLVATAFAHWWRA